MNWLQIFVNLFSKVEKQADADDVIDREGGVSEGKDPAFGRDAVDSKTGGGGELASEQPF